MSRHRRGSAWLTLVGVVCVGACHGDGPMAPPAPQLREVVVSNPVARPSPGAARPAIPLAQAATAETTYVSLPPGTAPTGHHAPIQTLRSGRTDSALGRNGGY